MYLLIREEDGNLFASDLLAMEFETFEDAVAELEDQYQSALRSEWAGDHHIETDPSMPHAFVSDVRGCSYEWRVIQPVSMKVRSIAKQEIVDGMRAGYVSLTSPAEGGTACMIGERWFWFGDDDAETLPPSSYIMAHGIDEIHDLIVEALGTYEGDEDWWYWRYFIDEMRK